jgi:feruloyl esterase
MRNILPIALAALVAACGSGGPHAKACRQITADELGAASASAAWHWAFGGHGYCEVTATLKPEPKSNIGVVYLLPDKWNGKLYGIGGGAWAGDERFASAGLALTQGYATMQTDAGHVGPVFDNSWVIDPIKAKDFAWRAIHEMTVAGKRLAARYYGRPYDEAYFVGCSTGGRMALMEAQRFPADYDAIVAGSPVYSLQNQMTGLMASNLFAAPGAAFTSGDLDLASDSAIAACDADDGLKDGLINDPRACHWNPASIQCSGAKTGHCLAAPQVAALETLYKGIKSPDGQWAMWPMSRGGETHWDIFVGTDGRPDSGEARGLAALELSIFNRLDVDWAHFSAVTDAPQVRRSAFAQMYDAKDPDLSAFFGRGGKLLMWEGEDDPGPTPTGTLDYATQVIARNPRAAQQFRLFLVPGVGHCGGYSGPDVLPHDVMIDAWARGGKAPDTAMATLHWWKTRPVCAWPKVAHYKGSGRANDSSSWACVSRKP